MSILRFFFRRRTKHEKLCEEWALTSSRECIEVAKRSIGKSATFRGFKLLKEATFTLKYLGSTYVDTPSDEEATVEAIKTVVNMNKVGERRIQTVNLTVNLHGIWLRDAETNQEELHFSIYKISYCSADSSFGHIFAFIATNLDDTMECHTFLCHKGKIAQIVTLTVAYAFNTAYEDWQLSQSDPRNRQIQDKSPADGGAETKEMLDEARNGKENQSKPTNEMDLLIDLSSEDLKPVAKPWVLFDDETVEVEKLQIHSPSNNIPLATISGNASCHVIPRPTPKMKAQNTWGESSSANLMCS